MDQYLKDSPSEYPSSTSTNTNHNSSQTNQHGNFEFPDDNLNQQFQQNDFSLNIEQPYASYDDQSYPVVPGSEFLSPGSNLGPSSYQEPFLDDLDNLQSKQTVNLDELVSPSNNTNGFDQFVDPQYFSPPSKQTINIDSVDNYSQFGNLNSNFSPNNNTNFDFSGGSYLSPQPILFGESFQNSYDTLRSPQFGSYLNSPPQHNPLTSTSIPNTMNSLLSPPNPSVLGTSAPTLNHETPAKSLPSKQLTKEEKARRRREFHNAVERRRRDLIKERIKQLGQLVPPSLLNPQLVAVQTLKNSKLDLKEINELLGSVKVKELKPNKSTILNKSVDYINHLKYVLEEQESTLRQLEAKLNSLLVSEAPAQSNPNFMEDFQNQSQSYVKQEEQFDPDEFFLEIVTGSEAL